MITPKPNKQFKLLKEDKEYLIEISDSTELEKISIKIKEISSISNIYFQNSYSLKELKNVNKSFKNFGNMNEAISSIEKKIEEKNVNLKFEKDSLLLILNEKGQEIASLKLKRNILPLEEINENLTKEINNLKNRMNELEIENKNNVNKLKDEIELLKMEIKELKKDNLDTKKKLNKIDNEANLNNKRKEENLLYKSMFNIERKESDIKFPLQKSFSFQQEFSQQPEYFPQFRNERQLPDSSHEHGLFQEPTHEKCKICQKLIGGILAYVCHNCSLVLCNNCAKTIFFGNKVKEIHPHRLSLKVREAWKCDICLGHYRDIASFNCALCDFDACLKCYIKS